MRDTMQGFIPYHDQQRDTAICAGNVFFHRLFPRFDLDGNAMKKPNVSLAKRNCAYL